MPKRATLVQLREEERAALLQVTKRHKSGQQYVLRARIVLAAGEGKSNVTIAQELAVSVETVRLWRDRCVALQGIDLKDKGVEQRLADAPVQEPLHASVQSNAVRWNCSPVKLQPSQDAPSVSGRGGKLLKKWCGEASSSRSHDVMLPARKGGFQPHRFRYWLTEVPDEQREQKINEGCELYATAAQAAKRGERTISMDELTGV